MPKTIPLIMSLFLSFQILAQESNKAHHVYLLGNFTDIEYYTLFKRNLQDLFDKTEGDFTLLLNGDLVDRKIKKSTMDEQIVKLYMLIDLVERYPNGNLIILSGDRDWNSSKKGGQKSLRFLEERVRNYIRMRNRNNSRWAVKDGCPGPEVIEINDYLTMVAINSQWWNHPFDKIRPADAACSVSTPESFREELEDAIADNQDKNVLIVGHHPFYSLGNYGGHFSLGDHFSPFPIFGSFRAAYKANIGTVYDISNERLEEYVESLKNLFYFEDNLIFAGGHEKNQQIIRDERNFIINSGAPKKGRFAGKNDQTLFSSSESGLMELTYYENGLVQSKFWTYEGLDSMRPGESITLFHAICGKGESSRDPNLLHNMAYVPCRPRSQIPQKMSRSYDEEVSIAGGGEYKAGNWKKLWFGNHYRKSWTTPIKVPYLNLDTTFNGLTIYKKGGGRQTTSLKFKSGNGTEYTFRSVNKDPSKALNYRLRPTFVSDVLRDQTSTQHPYGALVVDPLLDKIDILHASPKLYVLPDDKKLGPFRLKYAKLFGMLEENPGKPNNEGKLFGNAEKILRSSKMIRQLFQHTERKVDQEEFVRARLFDLWVGDWSKHEDNWKWAATMGENGVVYRPIPRDRDHVFSKQDGIIPWLADRQFGLQNIEGFQNKIKGLRSLMWQARHMDRFLATESTKETWLKQAAYIKEQISNEDINKAIQNLPPEIQEISGEEISKKLMARLPDLEKYAADYYKMLSKEVEVMGSIEEEYFEIEYLEGDKVSVKIYSNQHGLKGSTPLYERIFLPEETKEIRIFGLNDDDIFETKGGNEGGIKVDIFGGPGDDLFKDFSTNSTSLWDKGKGTQHEIEGNAKIIRHWNKDLYEYDRQKFKYDFFLPLFYLTYDNFIGFGASLGGRLTTQRYTKDDYSTKHAFGVNITTDGNKSISYSGRFHQIFKRWDLMLNASYADPSYYNFFFGIGNNTQKNEELFDDDYYSARIKQSHFSIGTGREFWKYSSLNFNIGFESVESEVLENTILEEDLAILGAGTTFNILPISGTLNLDFRDSRGLPYRGTRAFVRYQNGTILNGDQSNYGIIEGIMEYYFSTKKKNPLTVGIRIGGAKDHGDVPFYKQPSIGSTNGLRGYFKNRFTGESYLYLNTVLRYQLIEKETNFFPIKFGLKVFYDRGKVFEDGEDNSPWRDGYGFGVYFVPLTEAFTVSLTFGFSEEETALPMISLGRPF